MFQKEEPKSKDEKSDRQAAVTATSGFPGPDPTAESARRGEARAAGRQAADAVSTVKTDKNGVPQARSGGPLHADPKKGPVNSAGVEPTHPPDLADNPPGVGGAKRSAFGGFPPIPITKVEDEDEVIEKIRLTDKADVLYLWRDQERAAEKPRQNVIDAIHARLTHVQGPPLRD